MINKKYNEILLILRLTHYFAYAIYVYIVTTKKRGADLNNLSVGHHDDRNQGDHCVVMLPYGTT